MDNLSSTGLVGIGAAFATVLGAFVKIALDWRAGKSVRWQTDANAAQQTADTAISLIAPLREQLDSARSEAVLLRRDLIAAREESATLRRELDTVNSDVIPRLERRIDRLTAENERLDRAVKLLTKGENGH
jgi:cob(I)alamin adenosyltransferase